MFEASFAELKPIRAKSLAQSRYPPAIAAGLLLAAAFPKIGIAGFAWIAPGLMLATALGKPGRERFRIGYVAGLAYYLPLLHWLLSIPVTGFPIFGWVALCAYLALYPATWVWLAAKVPGLRRQATGATQAGTNWLAASEAISSWSWSRRMFWAFSCAAIWVALEMVVARFLGGFPWNQLGVSQYHLLPLVQLASFTGVYGISFLVAWTSASLFCAAAVIIHRPALRSLWIGEILLPFVAVVAVFAFGFHRIERVPAAVREMNVTLVQPSIPQTLIWNTENNLERFRELIQLSEQALTNRTDLLIWPEAGVPGLARWDTNIYPVITRFVRQHRVWLILGSDDIGRPAHPAGPDDYDYYNASFLVSPAGEFVARYKKRNLVIFGEYIPLEHWLPFVKWFTPVQGSFTPGNGAVPFELTGEDERPREPQSEPQDGSPGASHRQRVKTSVLICFEDTFAPLARETAENDTDFLVNITNDGWFGESAEPWQHAAAAMFRAVENGLPLVRCTNTGLTCWYDAVGRRRELFMDPNGSVYGAGFMTVKIPLLAPGERRPPTYYHQHGDWFGWGCVAVTAALAAMRFVHRNDRFRSSGSMSFYPK